MFLRLTTATVLFVLAVTTVHAIVPPLSALRCPPYWLHRPTDDSCYRLWPTDHVNVSTKVKMQYREAEAFCAESQGGAMLPVVNNASHLEWLRNFIGRGSGHAVWLGVRAD